MNNFISLLKNVAPKGTTHGRLLTIKSNNQVDVFRFEFKGFYGNLFKSIPLVNSKVWNSGIRPNTWFSFN